MDGLFASGAGGARIGPDETSDMPVTESSSRFVIGCWVHSFGGRAAIRKPPTSSRRPVVPVELDVR